MPAITLEQCGENQLCVILEGISIAVSVCAFLGLVYGLCLLCGGDSRYAKRVYMMTSLALFCLCVQVLGSFLIQIAPFQEVFLLVRISSGLFLSTSVYFLLYPLFTSQPEFECSRLVFRFTVTLNILAPIPLFFFVFDGNNTGLIVFFVLLSVVSALFAASVYSILSGTITSLRLADAEGNYVLIEKVSNLCCGFVLNFILLNIATDIEFAFAIAIASEGLYIAYCPFMFFQVVWAILMLIAAETMSKVRNSFSTLPNHDVVPYAQEVRVNEAELGMIDTTTSLFDRWTAPSRLPVRRNLSTQPPNSSNANNSSQQPPLQSPSSLPKDMEGMDTTTSLFDRWTTPRPSARPNVPRAPQQTSVPQQSRNNRTNLEGVDNTTSLFDRLFGL